MSSFALSTVLLLATTTLAMPTKTTPLNTTLTRRASAADGIVTAPSFWGTSSDIYDGLSSGYDTYIEYGCASTAAWPPQSSWVSFVSMFNANKPLMFTSCSQFNVPDDNGPEVGAIWDGVQQVAAETGLDHRFILAVIMQESGGCVRAPTSNYGVRNPGIMQTHNGGGTCNSDITGQVQAPCPSGVVTQMIREGAAGTTEGDGLAQTLNEAVETYGAEGAMAYYTAARIYNSGSVAADGCLEAGIATHCYASDIANRLTGWVFGEKVCSFDG